jgi:hypothetical protein
MAMKNLYATLLIVAAVSRSDPVSAKDTCTHTWGKGNFKTFKQVQGELQQRLGNAKILRFSLCGAANEHYFQVTILEASGKVHVVTIAAH